MIERMYLLLIRLGDHVPRHVSDALVDDFGHGRHDPLGLGAIQALAFQTLNKMVGIKVKVIAAGRRGEEPPVNVEGSERKH